MAFSANIKLIFLARLVKKSVIRIFEKYNMNYETKSFNNSIQYCYIEIEFHNPYPESES